MQYLKYDEDIVEIPKRQKWLVSRAFACSINSLPDVNVGAYRFFVWNFGYISPQHCICGQCISIVFYLCISIVCWPVYFYCKCVEWSQSIGGPTCHHPVISSYNASIFTHVLNLNYQQQHNIDQDHDDRHGNHLDEHHHDDQPGI